MTFLPFALLALALLLFLASTRQIALWLRAVIWFAGLVSLSWGGWFAASGRTHTGIFAVLGDFFSNLGAPGNSILAQAVGGNWASVGGAIGPMLDAFLIIGAVVAVVALVAFTPGEGVERAERPVNIALIGAMAGGLLALTVVSVGLGGVAKRKVYLNTVSAEDVVDGDTISMGDVSLRLWGIDAPEQDQLCRSASGDPFECGDLSREHLAELVAGKLVWCGPPLAPDEPPLPTSQMPALAETFGRPIVTCRIRSGEGEIDVAEAMARDGYVHLYEDAFGVKSIYQDDIGEALRMRSGLHQGELLPPWLWRNDPAAKCGFLERIGFEKIGDRLRKSCLGFDAPDNAPLDPAPVQ
jgi:endonuclease YncB( thermonuclease family)